MKSSASQATFAITPTSLGNLINPSHALHDKSIATLKASKVTCIRLTLDEAHKAYAGSSNKPARIAAWRKALAEEGIALVVTAVTATPLWDKKSKVRVRLAKRACTVLGLDALAFSKLCIHETAPTDGTGKRKVDGSHADTRLGKALTPRWANERFRQVMMLVREFRTEWPNQSLLSNDDVEFIRMAVDTALAMAEREEHTSDIYDVNPTRGAVSTWADVLGGCAFDSRQEACTGVWGDCWSKVCWLLHRTYIFPWTYALAPKA